jgi:hypothetical protein
MTHRPAVARLVVAAACVAAVAAALFGGAAADDETRQFTFAWPFSERDGMRPRGGTTAGPEVVLLQGASDAWTALREPGLSDFERDRRAILAMAGGYRTSFDFIETVGFTEDFRPSRPYQSWATEYVFAIEDAGDFISLQHVLVMFFAGADGHVQGPIVQKHWRQDWRYEDRDLHTYTGHDRWQRRRPAADDLRGTWSQAVYQVDDSPRYEAIGRWTHDANYSAWTSEETWRPLPRRESSVRDDYDVLVGTNRHTITPTGWVQEEENLKVVLDRNGEPTEGVAYLARELGVNRYERVVGFDFSAGDTYWQRTHEFWADVREAWRGVYARYDVFELAGEVDGRALFERMFEYAAALEQGAPYDRDESRRFAQETLDAYLE